MVQQLQFESVERAPLADARQPTRQRARKRRRITNNPDERPYARPTRNRRPPSPAELLLTPGALLTRSHLRGLGLERRAIDAVYRALPVVALPGYSRPMIRAEQYLEFVEKHTYRDDRVRPCGG
jgi:hypothetical protein